MFRTLVSLIIKVNLFLLTTKVYSAPSIPLVTFLNQSQTEHKRNLQLCYTFDDQTPGLPCNSAMLGMHREDSVWFYSFGNNNLGYFQGVSDIINTPIKSDHLLPLIDHNSNDQFQAGSSLGYVTDTWGFNFIPAKILLFTHIRNPALPRITVFASKEEEAQFQVGSFINKEWSWGLQTRGVHRRFTYVDNYLSDYFTDDANSLAKIQNQYALYIEPSLLYSPEEAEWNPLFSVTLQNTGTADKKIEPFDFNPNLNLGLSLSKTYDLGQLQVGLTSQSILAEEKYKFLSGIGARLSLIHFEVFGSLTEVQQQIGFGLKFSAVTSSISYLKQDWNNTPLNTTQSHWRWDLGFLF